MNWLTTSTANGLDFLSSLFVFAVGIGILISIGMCVTHGARNNFRRGAMKISEYAFTAAARLAGLGVGNANRVNKFLSPGDQSVDAGLCPIA